MFGLIGKKKDVRDGDLLGQSGKFFNTMFSKQKANKEGKKVEVLTKNKEEVKIELTETISEVSANDFGYFTLKNNIKQEGEIIKKKNNQMYLESEMKTGDKAQKDKFSMTEFNLVSFLNDNKIDFTTGKQNRFIDSNYELAVNLGKDDSDWSKIKMGDPSELTMNHYKKNPNSAKINRQNTMSLFEAGAKEGDDGDYLMRNTENSFILDKQVRKIGESNDYEGAFKGNFNYKFAKIRYEYVLIKRIVQKYKDYQKGDTKVRLSAVEVYESIFKTCGKFVEEVESRFETGKPVNYNEIKQKSRNYLIIFITAIKQYYRSNNREKGNYTLWKKKLSELTNIWDLYASNGIYMKFSFRYLILKRFITLRSYLKQNNLDGNNDDQYGLNNNLDSKNNPHGLIEENGLFRSILDVVIAVLILYSLIVMPLNMFLGYTTETFDIFEKLVDCLFLMEMLIRVRTVYRDKSNNVVFDLNLIFYRYFEGLFFFDLIACVPWDFFFLDNNGEYNISIKFIRSLFKVMRLGKLAPIIMKIENLKGANYFRLFKLFFIFMFFSHWMGTILFWQIKKSMTWDLMSDECYTSLKTHNQQTLTLVCSYIYSIYTGAYLIPGQNPSTLNTTGALQPSTEYAVLIVEYMMGSILSAYIVGGMSSIILNLNQGQNFFSSKIDLLNEHMSFYEISEEIQKDVIIYYDYLWLRHKDVVYGKQHFDLLSNSLREKFEKLNLPGNEILLATFYNLNIGNSKLIGQILMDLKKTIVFPYEILIEEGSVTTGIYILYNGFIELTTVNLPNLPKKTFEFDFNVFYSEYIKQISENEKNGGSKSAYLDESHCYMFPLLPSVIKTGRNWQRAFSKDFADLLFLPINSFDKLVENFPIEIHIFKQKVVKEVQEQKLFDNEQLFTMISRHSSRSVDKYYEPTFDKFNIWIPIPIPISQRKIAKNYISCFIKKVKNHAREILTEGDLNICLNSVMVTRILSSNLDKNKDEKKNGDKLEDLKHLSLNVNNICERINKILEKQMVEEEENY